MPIYRLLAPLLALASLAANAQDFRSLTYLDQVPVASYKAEGGFAVQQPMKCGLDGVLYVRFASANSEPAVTLIGDVGKIISNIRLSEIPEFSQDDFYDFAPANGEVFVLSGKGNPIVRLSTTLAVLRSTGDTYPRRWSTLGLDQTSNPGVLQHSLPATFSSQVWREGMMFPLCRSRPFSQRPGNFCTRRF